MPLLIDIVSDVRSAFKAHGTVRSGCWGFRSCASTWRFSCFGFHRRALRFPAIWTSVIYIVIWSKITLYWLCLWLLHQTQPSNFHNIQILNTTFSNLIWSRVFRYIHHHGHAFWQFHSNQFLLQTVISSSLKLVYVFLLLTVGFLTECINKNGECDWCCKGCLMENNTSDTLYKETQIEWFMYAYFYLPCWLFWLNVCHW